MNIKRTNLAALAVVCSLGAASFSLLISSPRKGNFIVATPLHQGNHTLTELGYQAPGAIITKEGNKDVYSWEPNRVNQDGYIPYYRCEECCASDANSARFLKEGETYRQANLEELRVPGFIKRTALDAAEGDLIRGAKADKIQHLDQTIGGPSQLIANGTEGNLTYVDDGHGCAIFFSRSGAIGEKKDTNANDGTSEFRFASVPTRIESFSFSYRYLDYGEGVWTNNSDAEPLNSHVMIQAEGLVNYGYSLDARLTKDDKWHDLTITVAELTLGHSNPNYPALTKMDLKELAFKIVDFRGHILLKRLTLNLASRSLTLKNVLADGADKIVEVPAGQMPEIPTLENHIFKGWVDLEGNPVTEITGDMTLVASWNGDGDYGKEMVLNVREHQGEFGSVEGYAAPNGWIEGDYEHRMTPDSAIDWGLQNYGTKESPVVFARRLPAFNYAAYDKVHFAMGHRASDGQKWWLGAKDDAHAIGTLDYVYELDLSMGAGYQKYQQQTIDVTIQNGRAHIANLAHKSYYDIVLDADVVNGRIGLPVFYEGWQSCQCFGIRPFEANRLDYMAKLREIEVAAVNATAADFVDELMEYRSIERHLLTTYELHNHETPTAISSLMSALGSTKVKDYSRSDLKDFLTDRQMDFINKDNERGFSDADLPNYGFAMDISTDEGANYNLRIPSFDFSIFSKVTFAFGATSNGADPHRAGVVMEGNDLGIPTWSSDDDEQKAYRTDYEATVIGKNVAITMKTTTRTYNFQLPDDVYNGKRGLDFVVTDKLYVWFTFTDIHGTF